MRTIIHACGGCGINITAQNIDLLRHQPEIYGEVAIKYVDTARADVDEYKFIDDKDIFIITSNKEGAGGIREALDSYVSEDIKTYVDTLKLKKDEIHIVISSASGGSGSSIGPRLVHNLKMLGHPVIYVMVTDTSSILYTNTSLKTAKHIEIAGNKYKYSVPTIIIDNKDPIDVVNTRVSLQVEMLSILFNGLHKSIDSTDCLLFASNAYDKEVTGLVSLSIHTSDTISKLSDSVISTMRILTDNRQFKVDTDILPKLNQYKIGYPNETIQEIIKKVKLSLPIYYAISSNNALGKLNALKAELDKKATIKEEKKSFVDEDDDIGVDI